MTQRLHIGCGSVYLDGWVNIDLRQSGSVLASEQPDLALQRAVPESAYYSGTPNRTLEEFAVGTMTEAGERVCDRYGSFESIPCDDGQADEILARQVFEHLSSWEVQRGLKECRRVLKVDGLLRLSVPDVEATITMWRDAIVADDQATEEFCRRHVFGSGKSDAFHHLCAWSEERLRDVCARYGFEFVEQEENIHAYPAICLKFRKLEHSDVDRPAKVIPVHKASWEYCGTERGTPLVVPPDWKCLEIGPGNNPWPRADFYVDANPQFLRPLPREKTLACDVENLCDHLKLPNGEKYDMVLSSHILEHVIDPHAAALQLSRVAKRGVVVCPSPAKEGLFNHHEEDHRWWVWSLPGRLVFMPLDQGWRNQVYNRDVSAQLHQLFRLGAERFGESGEQAREWFYTTEPLLDVVHHWEGELKVEVLR